MHRWGSFFDCYESWAPDQHLRACALLYLGFSQGWAVQVHGTCLPKLVGKAGGGGGDAPKDASSSSMAAESKQDRCHSVAGKSHGLQSSAFLTIWCEHEDCQVCLRRVPVPPPSISPSILSCALYSA